MTQWTDILTHPSVHRLGWTLLHFVWQGAVIGTVGALLMASLRRRSPHARYAALLAILGLAVMCPIGTFAILSEHAEPHTVAQMTQALVPTHSTSLAGSGEETSTETDGSNIVWTAEPREDAMLHPTGDGIDGAHRHDRRPKHAATEVASEPGVRAFGIDTITGGAVPETMLRPLRRALPWLVVGWCLGVTLLAIRMVGGWWRARTFLTRHVQPLRATWQPAAGRLTAALGVRRAVRWLESSVASVPFTVGWLRPVVLVPTSVLTGLTPSEIECLLAHELAHIRRHDYLVILLQCVVEVLLFYHPAVWWISRRLRHEREQVCDELAVSVTGDRVAYSRALLSVAELAIRPNSLALAADGGELMQRVQSLVGAPAAPTRNSIGAALSCMAIIIGSAAYLLTPAINAHEVVANDESSAADSPKAPEIFSEGKFRLLPIGGQVVDAKGQPVAGANVYMREAIAGYRRTSHAIKSGDLARVTTGLDGEFRFVDVPAKSDTIRVDVVVVAKGFALAWKHLPGGVPRENVRMVLKRPTQLSGWVLDTSGNPVPEARVQLEYTMSIRHITQADLDQGRWPRVDDARHVNLRGFHEPPSAQTDVEGRFTLKGLPPGLGIGIRAIHPQYELTDVFAATVEEIDSENASKAKRNVQTGEMRVLLGKARRLKVKVVYEDSGAPAAGARYPDVLNFITRPPRFEADEMGQFEIAHLSRHSVRLHVYPPEGSDYHAVYETVIIPEDVYEKMHVVKLPRGAIVSGRVIDEQSGEGIGDVPVYASRVRGQPPTRPAWLPSFGRADHRHRTQVDGSFRLVIPPGNVIVYADRWVLGDHTPPQSGSLTARRMRSQMLAQKTRLTQSLKRLKIQQTVTATVDRPVTGVILKLGRAPVVKGTVYDAQGQPAVGVSISGTIWLGNDARGGIRNRALHERTDERGRFVLKTVFNAWEPDILPRPVELIFRDRRGNLGQIVLLDAPTKDDDLQRTLDVQLKSLGVVTGRFVDADTGEPVSGVRVTLYKRDAGSDAQISHAVSPELRSGRDGRFELAGAFEGADHFIRVTGGRFRNFRSRNTRFVGRYGQRHDLGDLKLEPPDPPADQQLDQVQAPSVAGLSGDEAFELLIEQYTADYAAYQQAFDKAKPDRMRSHIVARREPTPVYAEAFEILAEAHRDSDVELKSLIWILNCRIKAGSSERIRPLKPPAADRLLEAYADRKELAKCVVELLIYPKYPSSGKATNVKALATARRLLLKNPHREVQGRTCYEVTRRIKSNSHYGLSKGDREQAIKYLQRVIDEFADIPDWRRGTLGEAAKRDLFELQHLVEGAPAPETTGTDVDGKPMSLSDFRGKVVVLDFWASSYGSWNSDLPKLNALAEEFGDRVAVLGVMSDPLEEAKQAVEQHKVCFRNWVDGPDREGPIVARWNIDSRPTRYVLDQRGVIRHKKISEHALRDAVWKLLQEGEPAR